MALVNPKSFMLRAKAKKQGICAFNVVNIETMEAVISAANETKTEVMVCISEGAIKYAGLDNLVSAAKNFAKKYDVDFALHLDHGRNYEICEKCILAGLTSVMIDASQLPFKENVEETKRVAKLAHKHGVFCEAELGTISGIEEHINISNDAAFFTNPKEALDFVKKTEVDALAISVGTSHGAYKISKYTGLKLDLIEKIKAQIPNTLLVLHGASSINQTIIDRINKFGGQLKNTSGTNENEIKKAITAGITKINIDSDLRLSFTAGVRELLTTKQGEFDIRKIIGAGTDEMKKTAVYKINLLSK